MSKVENRPCRPDPRTSNVENKSAGLTLGRRQLKKKNTATHNFKLENMCRQGLHDTISRLRMCVSPKPYDTNSSMKMCVLFCFRLWRLAPPPSDNKVYFAVCRPNHAAPKNNSPTSRTGRREKRQVPDSPTGRHGAIVRWASGARASTQFRLNVTLCSRRPGR